MPPTENSAVVHLRGFYPDVIAMCPECSKGRMFPTECRKVSTFDVITTLLEIGLVIGILVFAIILCISAAIHG